MAMLLLHANATVTICHSATPDLGALTRQADIVVAAVGKRHMLTADMVKRGAVVIDVGMNRGPDGKLCGDVDFAHVREVAGYITPVPGGVGPMTRAMLLVNTLEAAERAAHGVSEVPAMLAAAVRNPLLDQRAAAGVRPHRRRTSRRRSTSCLADAEAALARATSDAVPPDYDAISAVLDVATERLGFAWRTVGHLHAVADTPELRAAFTGEPADG